MNPELHGFDPMVPIRKIRPDSARGRYPFFCSPLVVGRTSDLGLSSVICPLSSALPLPPSLQPPSDVRTTAEQKERT